MQNRTEQVMDWLATFSEVAAMSGNEAALEKEVETIVRVFDVGQAEAHMVDETFRRVKMTNQSRAWPTAATVMECLNYCQRQRSGEHAVAEKGGDLNALGSFDRSKVEGEVLPNARRWMRMYPGLRGHARKTLEFWGQPVVDDRGKAYTEDRKAKA